MNFSLSTNIKSTQFEDISYIVTQNAERTAGNIISDYMQGIHSFNLIGTYGTGKSSFLLAFENALSTNDGSLFKNNGQFNGYKSFRFLNIVGANSPLSSLLWKELGVLPKSDEELFETIDTLLKQEKRKKKFVVIAIDEFGKILEYAAKNNPEGSVYFLQQLSELINSPKYDNVLMITTLHQNMGAYAKGLTIEQKNEWEKVKGRYKEVVFTEPVEQLLEVAADRLGRGRLHIEDYENFNTLFHLAKNGKFIAGDTMLDVAKRIYPMDIIAAVVLTRSIQRYGQNERSLFTFITSKEEQSLANFKPKENETYNLANVYDYIVYSFYSMLSEVNSDSSNWRAAKSAIERVEGLMTPAKVIKASKIVKAISLLNIFCPAVKMDKDQLCQYAELAMGITKADQILDELTTLNIIRFAKYKNQFILFEGSDINIEDEMFRAVGQVSRPEDYVSELIHYFGSKVVLANAAYYKTGTPRYFSFILSDEAKSQTPTGDIDGFVNLVFPKSKKSEAITKAKDSAILYAFFQNTKEIVDHIYEIQKLNYVLKNVILNDKVAEREVNNLIAYEKDMINSLINNSLVTFSENVIWIYKGKRVEIRSQADFNRMLSRICDEVYSSTPIIKNELFNKQKVANSSISLARVSIHNAMLDPNLVALPNLGFPEDKFPPEKTIYFALLKQTGIHRLSSEGYYELGAPTSDAVKDLWNACEDFLASTCERQRKVGDLIKILQSAPFKLKQGFIDMWIPIYFIVKKQDYSLYSDEGVYIPNINREVLDLIQKNPTHFKVKAFAVDGIKVEFFNQYRNFLHKDNKDAIDQTSFIETIKPFLVFYGRLNEYAKTTRNFDDPAVIRYREVLANAIDPEKTFFEDMPAAFGFKNESLSSNAEFMAQYQNMIKNATHELVTCYQSLIDKIESQMVEILGVKSKDYSEYKKEVETRFKAVKESLLSMKQKSFLKGLLRSEENKVQWYESICYVALGKPLASLKDNEVSGLFDSLKFLVESLDRFIDISKLASHKTNAEVYNFDLFSTKGTLKSQSYVLPESQKTQSDELEKKLSAILSGDKNMDICTLLKVLKNKIEQ